jgi:hypothetical protein
MDFETFKSQHAGQLAAIPVGLWEPLYSKLSSETFDAGFYFALIEGPDGHTLRCIEGLPAESQIFLVDHAWTFANEEQAAKDLSQIPNLLDRMEVSLNVLNEHGGMDQGQWEEHQDMLQLIMDQSGCSREDAWAAYKEEHFDLVNAIAVGFFLCHPSSSKC